LGAVWFELAAQQQQENHERDVHDAAHGLHPELGVTPGDPSVLRSGTLPADSIWRSPKKRVLSDQKKPK
jgi:hypothetical protein